MSRRDRRSNVGWFFLASLGVAALATGAPVEAQLAISANDNKLTLVNGAAQVVQNPPPDTITIMDLNAPTPKVVAEIPVPTSVVGPPFSVAITPDESLALVTAAMRIDPTDKTKQIPDNKVSVVDLKATPPRVIGTLQAGAGAAGVSINRQGTLALVANRSEGTVSVLGIQGKTVTPLSKVTIAPAASGVSHAAFTPDGKTALVTRDGDSFISVLAIDGTKVEYTKRDLSAGMRPYGLDISRESDQNTIEVCNRLEGVIEARFDGRVRPDPAGEQALGERGDLERLASSRQAMVAARVGCRGPPGCHAPFDVCPEGRFRPESARVWRQRGLIQGGGEPRRVGGLARLVVGQVILEADRGKPEQVAQDQLSRCGLIQPEGVPEPPGQVPLERPALRWQAGDESPGGRLVECRGRADACLEGPPYARDIELRERARARHHCSHARDRSTLGTPVRWAYNAVHAGRATWIGSGHRRARCASLRR